MASDLLLPSYPNGFARCAAESENPDLWTGLVGLWAPYLGPTGSKLFDWSGRKNNGTLTNMDPGTDWVESPYGYALDFDGNNDFVSLPGMASLFSTDASLWMLLRLVLDPPVDVNKTGFATLGTHGVGSHYPYTDSKLYLDVFSTVRSIDGYDNSAFDKTQWHNLIITTIPGAGNYKLYQNARLTTTALGPVNIAFPSNAKFGEGRKERFLWGEIAAAALWSRALAPSEIQHLYRDPHALTRPRSRIFPSAAAPPGLSIPIAMHHYKMLAG